MLALCVIFAHSFDLLKKEDPISSALVYVGLGRFAVVGFFLLSGYLITLSWMRSRSLGDFLKRRALRIYPGYIVVCLFCALIVAPRCSYSPAWYWSQFHPLSFFTHIITLRMIDAPAVVTPYMYGNINGALWTIHEEFICYLIVAFLGYLHVFRRRLAIPVLFLLVFGMAAFLGSGGSVVDPSGPQELARMPPLLAAFLLGSCFFLYREKIVFSVRGAALCFALFLILVRWSSLGAVICLPFQAYLLFAFAFSPRIRLHRFAQRGDFSYGAYLYAFPIQVALTYYFPLSLNGWTLFLITTPLTLLCAMLSWNFVEKPFLRRKQSSVPRPPLEEDETLELRFARAEP